MGWDGGKSAAWDASSKELGAIKVGFNCLWSSCLFSPCWYLQVEQSRKSSVRVVLECLMHSAMENLNIYKPNPTLFSVYILGFSIIMFFF